MRKVEKIFLCTLLFFALGAIIWNPSMQVKAESADATTQEPKDSVYYQICGYSDTILYNEVTRVPFYAQCSNPNGFTRVVTVSSSDASVAAVVTPTVTVTSKTASTFFYVEVKDGTKGSAEISVTDGVNSVFLSVFVQPEAVRKMEVKQTGVNKVSISWDSANEAEGYQVYRYKVSKTRGSTITEETLVADLKGQTACAIEDTGVVLGNNYRYLITSHTMWEARLLHPPFQMEVAI